MKNTIQTKRLTLQPYSDSDEEAMIELLTNEKIKESFIIPDFRTKNEVIDMFKKLQTFSHSEDHYERGIYLKQQLIGFLNDVEMENDKIELGYVIHPDYQKKGYATEALKAAIHDLRNRGFREIVTGAFENNKASIRVMKKCGMERIDKEEDIIYHNQLKHCCYYAIGREKTRVNILTSMFQSGFPNEFARYLQKITKKRESFVFIASHFKDGQEKTDFYFYKFLNMFEECGINFENSYVIDERMTKEQAQKVLSVADVVWLSGGDTPSQYESIITYGLDVLLKEFNGIVIGMSAGAINMAKTAICSLSCGHTEQKIYNALGLVDFSIEPHINKSCFSSELLQLSEKYPLYGMCDDSVIIWNNNQLTYMGDVFLIDKGIVKQISFTR